MIISALIALLNQMILDELVPAPYLMCGLAVLVSLSMSLGSSKDSKNVSRETYEKINNKMEKIIYPQEENYMFGEWPTKKEDNNA